MIYVIHYSSVQARSKCVQNISQRNQVLSKRSAFDLEVVRHTVTTLFVVSGNIIFLVSTER